MGRGDTKVVQVTNVAPQITRDQLKILFGYLGEIDDIRLYPKVRQMAIPAQLKICYIKFHKKSTAEIAQYITGTVLFDHALMVTLEDSGEIPDEDFALAITKNGTVVSGLCSSEATLPPHVINTIANIESKQVVETFDPNLESNGLAKYPPLPASYDGQKIEEIRRTVQIDDVDPDVCNEDYLEFFSDVAEVKYMCQFKSTSTSKTCMLVEFSNQSSIIEVLKMNGSEFKGNPIKVVHATQAIVKPDYETVIAEALSTVIISSPKDSNNRRNSSRRSRSRSLERRRRSRSRSRSRGGKRSRRRSRSRSRKRRSRDRKRSKSRSKSKKRSSKRKHSRSTSRDRKHHRRR